MEYKNNAETAIGKNLKILVINGSPKGKNSITFQTLLYLKQLYPDHQYRVIHAGAGYRKYEYDFTPARKLLADADLIIFAYPVYTFLAPSQLHIFMRMIKEDVENGNLCLEGKVCTQITTSKHFYDITAHKYIEDNCRDLGMKVLRGLSADMEDLTTEKGRNEARQYFKHIIWSIIEKQDVDVFGDRIKENLKNTVIVGDLAPDDYRLKGMIDSFMAICGEGVKFVNIHEFPFRGGCLSCFNCSTKGECIYTDGFQELLRNEIQGGDSIVLAFSIKDHSMGTIFKMYDDRQFCNGHRTVTMGRPFAYIVSGELSKEENLNMVIEARAQVGGNYLAGIASNENDYISSGESMDKTNESIQDMAKELAFCVENSYTQPANFYGVGGMKIFRDLIWQMQGMMKADYKFFKEHGQMDFPQKHPEKVIAMYAVGALMGNNELKKKMGNKMNEGMLMPYKNAIKKNCSKKNKNRNK